MSDALRFALGHRTQFLDASGEAVIIGKKEELTVEEHQKLLVHLRSFNPWRKGPFDVFGHRIDAAWKSDRKWTKAMRYAGSLYGKSVCDIGCNNGYYLYRMAHEGAAKVVGLDPQKLFKDQFDFLNALCPLPHVKFLEAGYDILQNQKESYDTIFCMGILYHRRNPMEVLEISRHALRTGGEIFIETMGLDLPLNECFYPGGKYAGSSGVFFIPSTSVLHSWLKRTGYREIVIHETHDSTDDQVRTAWADLPAFTEFLDPNRPGFTIEGYPAPLRILASAKK